MIPSAHKCQNLCFIIVPFCPDAPFQFSISASRLNSFLVGHPNTITYVTASIYHKTKRTKVFVNQKLRNILFHMSLQATTRPIEIEPMV